MSLEPPRVLPRFQLTPFGRVIGLRSAPGLLAIVAAVRGWLVAAGILLFVAVASDVLADSVADRRGWKRDRCDVQTEGFVDFVCFGWAPFQLAMAVSDSAWVVAFGLLFVVAGGFRLARFNVEGFCRGGYSGLPITYSGVIVPAAAALGSSLEVLSPALVLSLVLALLALAMASGRFVTPRISL